LRRFVAVLSALALVALVASPVAAAKPAQFTTTLTVNGVAATGSYNGGFFVPTSGVATDPQITLGITGTVASPALPTGIYPFTLKAGSAQRASLVGYFNAKWGCLTTADSTLLAFCAQIGQEIAGTAPFMYLGYGGTGYAYAIFDGFTYALSGGSVYAPLVIDNDYPTGTYLYTASLNGLSVQVKIKVYRG
jgi:hypothetical protein